MPGLGGLISRGERVGMREKGKWHTQILIGGTRFYGGLTVHIAELLALT